MFWCRKKTFKKPHVFDIQGVKPQKLIICYAFQIKFNTQFALVGP